ncbi:MAG: hypothetical protein ACKO7Z_04585, partial [Cyanobacteriota bacterium]
MASRDPYLARVNRALKELGCSVAIEVSPSGKRLRLRGSLPMPDGSWKQQRISTTTRHWAPIVGICSSISLV